MKTKIELVYHSNGRLEKIATNDDIVFQGSVATSEFFLKIAEGDEAWLPTDSVFISFTRADSQKSGPLLMRYDNGEWKYTSNGWLEDVDLSGNEGEYSVSVMMRRYSPLDNKTVVAVRTSETIILPISLSANWSPKDLTSGEYEAITSAISEQNEIIAKNKEIVEKNEETVAKNDKIVSDIKEKISNFKVGEVTVRASEPGAEPQVQAEIVDSDDPNEFKLNMDVTLPRGDKGEEAGFGEITATASELSSDAEPTATVVPSGTNKAKNFAFEFGIPKGQSAGFGEITVDTDTLLYGNDAQVTVTPSGADEAKNFHFHFEIPEGKTGQTGERGAQGFSVIWSSGAYDTDTTEVDSDTLNYPAVVGDTVIDSVFNVFKVMRGAVAGVPNVGVKYIGNIKGEKGETVGAVTSVNGETGAVQVTAESIGAAATSGIYDDLVAGRLDGVSIPENTDLNTLIPTRNKQLAVYVCMGNGISNTLINSPVKDTTFYMTSLKTWSSENKYYRVIQTIYAVNGTVHTRNVDYVTGDTPNWRSWKQITDCLPLTGGTLTGTEYIRNSLPLLRVQNTDVTFGETIASGNKESGIVATDKNDAYIGFLKFVKNTTDTYAGFNIRNKTGANYDVILISDDNNTGAALRPAGSSNNKIMLGASNNRWFGAFIGTAGISSQGNIQLYKSAPWVRGYDSDLDISATTGSNNYRGFEIYDKNDQWASTFRCYNSSDGSVLTQMASRSKRSGNDIMTCLEVTSSTDGIKRVQPSTNGDVNLGTSARKWKDVYATAFHGTMVASYLGSFTTAGTKTISGLLTHDVVIGILQGADTSTYSSVVPTTITDIFRANNKAWIIGETNGVAVYFDADDTVTVSGVSSRKQLLLYGI